MALPSSSDALTHARFLPLFTVALGAGLLVAALGAIAPQVALAPRAAFALAFTAVALEILLLAAMAPLRTTGGAMVVAVGALLIVLVVLRDAPARGLAPALLTLALGSVATLVGAALGARIEQPGQLVAVALVSGIADLWSVLDPGAPSAQLAAEAMAEPERLALFALPFPMLGSNVVPAVIGAGDVVFAALYAAVFRRHRLSRARVLAALGVGFALGLGALLSTLRPVPLLPLLGGAVVLCDARARSLPAREWRTVAAACAALLSVIALRVLR